MSKLPADCLNEIFEYFEDKKEIIISTPSLKPPLFNYITFIKYLSIDEINESIKNLFKNQEPTSRSVVEQEIFKMIMRQASLKELKFYYHINHFRNSTFSSYPGAIDCLKNLSTFSCYSDIYPEFFYQLSQICHNIQSLGVQFRSDISNGLADLISVQQNLKYLTIHQSYKCLSYIVPLLTKHSTTLIRLQINGTGNYESLLFISNFINLRELILSFDYEYVFEDFRTLQDVTFPRLRVLKFPNKCPNHEYLIKFLENNGKNLEEFDIDITDNSLNLAIAKFCPNLKSLFTTFLDDEVDTLKTILHRCQGLEIIKVWCGVWLREIYLEEIELFDVVARHSPRNFCELRLCYPYNVQFDITSVELETFFQSWKDRTPRKSLSFMIVGYILEVKEEIMKVIDQYIKLGVIDKFKIIKDYEEN
ncbi:13917_t:CDS:2 [Funneliformis geosporum]|uniref:13917_t:CDS:1 n=1 Tax=Funneliformis geosporum TaxID=1117311 RepID=A0A9W4SI47_9GLOM|nr:13917_t:CDS:2 [Funneliformis geosporum]